MARALGVFHLAGGAGALVILALPHWHGLRVGPVGGLGVLAIVYGSLLLVGGHRLATRAFSLVLVGSTAMVTAVAWAAGTGAGTASTAALYLPLGLFAAMLLGRAGLAIQMALTAAAYALCLAIEHQPGGPGQWFVTLATTATASLVVRWMVEHVRDAALADGLTGIDNRMAWDAHLIRQLAVVARHPRPTTVAIIDLDHFKEVNATRGHSGGDRLLIELTAVWAQQLRPGDELARYGGDEFTLLFPDTGLDDAERIILRLQQLAPPEGSFSVGLALWHPGERPEQLMARADDALFHAKASGRGRIVAAPHPAPAADRAEDAAAPENLASIVPPLRDNAR